MLGGIEIKTFSARVFSLYLRGYGDRAPYYNGPLGTILHACYLHNSFERSVSNFKGPVVCLSLTQAQQQNSTLLCDKIKKIDLSYQRGKALKSLMGVKVFLFIFQGIKAAIKLRKELLAYDGNRLHHLLAAGFQVAAGIHIGKVIAKSTLETIIWGSDHCVITRTAVIAKNSQRKKNYLFPHGPGIGETNKVRDRSIFDHIYVLNEFQKAIFLKWDPNLSITVIERATRTTALVPKPIENKRCVLFLNQLDLGLRPNDKFSPELDHFLSWISPDDVLAVVIKNQRQLVKFNNSLNTRFNTLQHFFGFPDFCSSHAVGSVVCVVFSSGVSVDLMLGGYDLALSKCNPLVEDDKARQMLGIPAPSFWDNTDLHHLRYNLNELEIKHA